MISPQMRNRIRQAFAQGASRDRGDVLAAAKAMRAITAELEAEAGTVDAIIAVHDALRMAIGDPPWGEC